MLFVGKRLIVAIAGASASCTTTPEASRIDPSTLSAPARGQGFQIRTPLFSVEPGTEVQDCYFFKVRDAARAAGLPENEPVNVHRIQLVQREGSHHMNIFRVRTIAGLDPAAGAVQRGLNGQGECFKSPNWSDWPLLANTQASSEVDWTFPDGVANVLSPDETLMLQTHYVNASTQRTKEGGEVAANFYTLPKEEVKAELGTLFATKQSIRICRSNPAPTFSGTCQFKSGRAVNIVAANAHFHARGKAFAMYAWDGTSIATPAEDKLFYRSVTWDDPPMLHSPALDVVVQPGGGVFYTCSYEWTPPADDVGGCQALDEYDRGKHPDAQPDCCYSFGPIVEKNEHCNAFVYYWPKQDDVFCN